MPWGTWGRAERDFFSGFQAEKECKGRMYDINSQQSKTERQGGVEEVGGGRVRGGQRE